MCTLDELVMFLAKTEEQYCKRLPLEWKQGKFDELNWCKCYNHANNLFNDKLTCKVGDKSMEEWETYCMKLLMPCSVEVSHLCIIIFL